MERAPYQKLILRLDFRRLSWSKMCERIGAIPAPPPTKTISASVSLAKNSPKGPYTVTLSPGFKLNTQDDMIPAGKSSRPGGGVATRILNLTMPFSDRKSVV